ncbi:hypothetical protein ACUN7V_16555 [Quadrisphaera oryzae]|uniref:hypothetical protein n=1 Tax=Quadrisphaera TaxID=317661 RepID=UPI0016468A07|nr:hypothetical protein [Quadrisphaera sp. RL12-1S]MBC3760887.1 hypothetical protein [Quadrisphaera sp. RL12-1S]
MSSGSSPRWLDLGPGEVLLRSAGANRSTGTATWALLLVAVDATVVVVLLTTDEWGLWVTAVAVALLATHLWLAARTLRGPRRAAGA